VGGSFKKQIKPGRKYREKKGEFSFYLVAYKKILFFFSFRRRKGRAKMARKKAFPSSTTGAGCLDDANEGRGQPAELGKRQHLIISSRDLLQY
jgi:hypothetical protein